MNGLAQRLRIRPGHLRLQLIERDVQVVGHVGRGDELAEVLEAPGGILDIGAGGQQQLYTGRQRLMARQLCAGVAAIAQLRPSRPFMPARVRPSSRSAL